VLRKIKPADWKSLREFGEKETGKTSMQTTGMDVWIIFRLPATGMLSSYFRPSLPK
jgi:hypothetical protein